MGGLVLIFPITDERRASSRRYHRWTLKLGMWTTVSSSMVNHVQARVCVHE